jgi:hypothetical protein
MGFQIKRSSVDLLPFARLRRWMQEANKKPHRIAPAGFG